ncbi:triple QxxK/R motif-containing protein isoform X1 [Mobula birostris]|uniref:triple QxxK/R motif-containing protein isoform X1 n=1 Tax=Mobula birostris TaxID=1983395 RepID=UPI003B289811
MGRKDASASKIPIDHYRKQIGKQDYKKTKSVLKATRLKAEAKKTAPGIRILPGMLSTSSIFCVFFFKFWFRLYSYNTFFMIEMTRTSKDVTLIIAAMVILLVAIYGFFYLKLTTEVDLNPDLDEN